MFIYLYLQNKLINDGTIWNAQFIKITVSWRNREHFISKEE
jgi:hypothetical protein